jgi:hypothetical protein
MYAFQVTASSAHRLMVHDYNRLRPLPLSCVEYYEFVRYINKCDGHPTVAFCPRFIELLRHFDLVRYRPIKRKLPLGFFHP